MPHEDRNVHWGVWRAGGLVYWGAGRVGGWVGPRGERLSEWVGGPEGGEAEWVGGGARGRVGNGVEATCPNLDTLSLGCQGFLDGRARVPL